MMERIAKFEKVSIEQFTKDMMKLFADRGGMNEQKAKRGYIDDIIEPDATRKRLIAAYEMLYGKKVTPVTKKHTAV